MTPWNAKQKSSYDIRSHVQSHLARWWAQRQNRAMNRGGWIWSTSHTCLVQGWLAYYNLEYGMIMAELSSLVGVPYKDTQWVHWCLDGFPLADGSTNPVDCDRAPLASGMISVLKAIRAHFSRDIGLPAARKIWDRRVIKSRLEGLAT